MVKTTCSYPSLHLVFERLFAAVWATNGEQFRGLRWLGLVHLSEAGHQTHAAAPLSLVTVGMTVRRVVADEVGSVCQSYHHLNTKRRKTVCFRVQLWQAEALMQIKIPEVTTKLAGLSKRRYLTVGKQLVRTRNCERGKKDKRCTMLCTFFTVRNVSRYFDPGHIVTVGQFVAHLAEISLCVLRLLTRRVRSSGGGGGGGYGVIKVDERRQHRFIGWRSWLQRLRAHLAWLDATHTPHTYRTHTAQPSNQWRHYG